jgi:hypothetical protein
VENKAKELDEYRKKIQSLLRQANTNYILVGLLLAKGVAEKYHKLMDYKRAEDMWESELGLKASTGWNYVRVAKMFAPIMTEGKALPDVTRLIRLLPVLAKADQTGVQEWFEKAYGLSPKDFNKEILVAQGKPDQDVCEHKNVETWSRCRDCSRWLGRANG